MTNNTTASLLLLAFLAFAAGAENAETSHGITAASANADQQMSVPATGLQQLSFSAPRFGRYTLQAISDQGSALQLIDRENGPGEWHGSAGENNGRFDTFLEAGDYRLRVQSSERGSGVAKVQIQPFEELQPEALQLVELKPENTTLADFQQRSWWLTLDEPRRIVIEAGGRHLQSLELWRDGRWRIPLSVNSEVVTAQPGQPQRLLNFSVQLEAGQYRLSAYGGAGEPWAETSNAAPLHLRWGFPALPAAHRQQFQASPLGIDRYRVPDTADYFRLELPEPAPATLAAGDWLSDRPFRERSRDSITAKSRQPIATLNLNSETAIDKEERAGSRLITVRAAAGQRYTLQHFSRSSHYTISQSGDWWIDSVHAGSSEDAIDATALLIAVNPRRNLRRIKATTAVEVNQRQGWRRRFNLLQPAEMFLQITEDGDYSFSQQTADNDEQEASSSLANLTLEPVYLSRPKDAPEPLELQQSVKQSLNAGLYRLRLEPRSKGIADLAIFSADTAVPAESLVQGSNRFGAVKLEKGWKHLVIPADQGGTKSGVILRPLPLDMRRPLSVTLAANESLSLPLQFPAAGQLTAADEYGNPPKLGSSDAEALGTLSQPSGTHNLSISNTAERSAVINLAWHDPRQQSDSPLPKAAMLEPPQLPRLSSGLPQFLDLASGVTQTFELRVEKPALYRIESSGLLSTSGQLRTRVTPDLATAESNGIGRNFLIQRYLRPGDYRLTVSTQGASAGRLGVSLTAAPLIDAGQLHADITSRQLLPAGQGLDQRLSVAEAGNYELQVLSQLRELRFRLEDSDGWPVLPPGNNSPLNLRLSTDNFRLIIEPGAVDSRVITRLAAMPETPEFIGYGPHTITLNQSVKKRWMEPAADESRQADRWLFSLSAAATVNISASDEMRGVLYRTDSDNQQRTDDERISDVLSPNGWQGDLPAGNYRLELEHGRLSNRVDYQLTVSSSQLLPGQSRSITAPASVPLSLPAGLSRITSFGPADVRARLYDHSGAMVASNDDGSSDWNFLIGTSLPAGQYRLDVEPVGARRATTEISLQAPAARLLPPQQLELNQLNEQTLNLQAQYTLPLNVVGNNNQLLLVRADAVADDASNGEIGIALEKCMSSRLNDAATETDCTQLANHSGQPAWLAIELGSEAMNPTTSNVSYRLRLWSQNDQATERPVRVRLLQTEPEPISERQLAEGITLPAVRLIPGPLTHDDSEGWSAARLELPLAGVFTGSTAGLRFSAAANATASPLQTATLAGQFLTSQHTLVAGLQGASLQAQRQTLRPDAELSLPLRSGESATLTIAAAKNPTLILARAHNGQPGIAANGSTTAAKTGFSNGSAVTVIDSNATDRTTTAVNAWKADENGTLALRLKSIALSPLQTATADDQGRVVLPPHSAVSIALPAGMKTMQLSLPSETAAVLKGEITLWSGPHSSSEQLQSDAGELRLYHAGSQPALFSLRHSPLSTDNNLQTPSRLSSDSPLWYESLTSRSQLHIRVDNPADETTGLELGGNIESATWSGDDGRHVAVKMDSATKSTSGPKITGGGIVSINAQPGLLAVWLDGDTANVFAASEVKPLSLPRTVSVIGQQTFSFSTAEPALLSVRGRSPALLQLISDDQNHNYDLYTTGARLDQYLPASNHELRVRLLGPQSVDSLTLTTRSVIGISATPPTEQSSPQNSDNAATQAAALRLAAGDSVLYSFSIDSDRKVGIGIKASPDQAEAQLMDSSGTLVGTGSTQFQSLKAGRYLLQVSAPADGTSLEVTPLIIGLQDQYDGPPADVLQNYIEQPRASAEGSR